MKELYETHNAEKIMQAEEIQTTLTEIARTGSIKDRLKAIDILCKMGGLYISQVIVNLHKIADTLCNFGVPYFDKKVFSLSI